MAYSLEGLEQAGSEFLADLPFQRVTAAGSAARYAPVWDPAAPAVQDLAYAMYGFDLSGYDLDESVRLGWALAHASSDAWLGLADRNDDRWVWQPIPELGIVRTAFENHIRADGLLLAVVMLTGSHEWELETIAIGRSENHPVASLIAAPTEGLAPLEVTCDASASYDPNGQITRFDWDLDGDGVFEVTAGTATQTVTYDAAGLHRPGVLVTDDEDLQDVAYAEVQAGLAPVAMLYAHPAGGDAPLTVQLNAAGSYDPDGDVSSFDWDLDGDSGFELLGASPTPATVTFEDSGRHQVSVRVTDDDGFTGQCHARIAVGVAPWPMYMHDPQRSGRSEFVGAQSNMLRWKFRTTGLGFDMAAPVVGEDGTTYLGIGHSLDALAPDGTILWTALAGIDPSTEPTLTTNGRLYVGAATVYPIGGKDGGLHAFLLDGTYLWTYWTPEPVFSRPVVDGDGIIYFGCQDSNLYAVNADGSLKWRFSATGRIRAAPAVGGDGTVYFGTSLGEYAFYAINPDGTEKWRYPTARAIMDPPILLDSGSVCFCSSSTLYSLKPNGSLNWAHELGGSGQPVIATDGLLYMPFSVYHSWGSDYFLYVLNQQGELDRSYEFDAKILNNRAVLDEEGRCCFFSNDGLYVCDPDPELQWVLPSTYAASFPPAIGPSGSCSVVVYGLPPHYEDELLALDAQGEVLWTHGGGGPVPSSPAVDAAGVVYVGGNDLYALNADGSLRWKYEIDGSAEGGPTVTDDGMVYICAEELVHAVDATGTRQWWWHGSDSSYSSPVVDGLGQALFVRKGPSPQRVLHAVDNLGLEVWTRGADGHPALGWDGEIIAGSGNTIRTLDTNGDTLQVLYLRELLSAVVTSNPTVGPNGRLYCGGGDWNGEEMSNYRLYALTTDGRPLWEYQPSDSVEIGQCPSLGPFGHVYFTQDDLLYALNAAGEPQWYYTAADHIGTAVTVDAAGSLYFGCDDGKVYALDQDRSLKWQFQTGAPVNSTPAIGADGTVYVGSDDGYLYAIGP